MIGGRYIYLEDKEKESVCISVVRAPSYDHTKLQGKLEI